MAAPPNTDDPRELAGCAVHVLLVDGNGVPINHDDRVLYGILAFAYAECGGALPSQCVKELTALMMKPPVERDALIRWFRATFP